MNYDLERQQRIAQLMRMRAETDRMERRMYICYGVAAFLAFVALILGAAS